MTPRQALRLAVAAAVLTLGSTACAGEDSETAMQPPTEAVAVEEYRAQADQVCFGTRSELQLLRTELYEREAEVAIPPDEAQQPFERAAALLRTELRELRTLEPPEQIADDVDAWLAEVEEAARTYEEAAGSPEAAAEALEEPDPLASGEERADELELGLCGTERIPDDEIGDPRSVPTQEDETTAPAIEEGDE